MQVVGSSVLKSVYQERKKSAKKYDYGHLLVVGGSKLYHGSSVFNALAAYCAGVDLVTATGPERAMDLAAACGGPDLITHPLEGDYLTPSHLDSVINVAKGKTAVVIGGGMGRRADTLDFIVQFLASTHLPVVVDADAIHAVAHYPEVFKDRDSVITPHSYEFLNLTGRDLIPDLEDEKAEILREESGRFFSTILFKGSLDLISDGEQTVKNKTGSPYMTVGGTGDVLAGVCGGLLAQGVEPFKSASAAAWINGKAGELAVEEFGPSLMASDILAYLPDVLRGLR